MIVTERNHQLSMVLSVISVYEFDVRPLMVPMIPINVQ